MKWNKYPEVSPPKNTPILVFVEDKYHQASNENGYFHATAGWNSAKQSKYYFYSIVDGCRMKTKTIKYWANITSPHNEEI